MSDTPANPHAGPPPHGRPRWRWLRVPALVVGCLLLALVTFSGWLLATSSGLRWLAGQAVGDTGAVSVDGVHGRLLGSFGVRTLTLKAGTVRLRAENVRLDWRPAALLTGRIEVTELSATSLDVLAPPSATPATLPADLRLPLPTSIDRLRLETLRVRTEEGGTEDFAARSLSARLLSDGQRHRLPELRAELDFGVLAAAAEIGASRPFALAAEASLVGNGGGGTQVSATVSGNLSDLLVKARGRGAGINGDGEARLTPFAVLPLAALSLAVDGLDPRAFALTAPSARLAIDADLRADPAAAQLTGPVSLRNASPAPFDRGGLPLTAARARATLSGQTLRVDDLALSLAGGGTVAGQLAWQWQQARGSADLKLRRLDLAALDTRLRTTRLDGSATLGGDAQAQQGVLSLADGALRLDARLTRAGDHLRLNGLRLTRGTAELAGHGELGLAGQRAFSFQGSLKRFDLAAFAQAPRTSLNADLELAGTLAPAPAGRLRFTVGDSRFAEQPVNGSGDVEFSGTQRARGDVELRLGSNRLRAHGGYGGAGDRLELDIEAPALAQLGRQFGGALTTHASLAGTLARPDARFAAQGRDLSLPGEHRLAGFSASGSLQGESVNIKLDATDYRQGTASWVQSLGLAVDGSRQRHELRAEARLAGDHVLSLRASGGLVANAGDWRDSQWQGLLAELSAAGPLPLRLQAPAPLVLGRQRLALGAAEFAVAGGRVQHAGSDWTPQAWTTRGRFTGIGIRPGGTNGTGLAAAGGGASQETLRLGGDWHLAQAASGAPPDGSLSLWREAGDWVLPADPPLALGIAELRLSARVADGRLRAELAARGARLGDWRGELGVPVTRGDAGWTIAADAPLSGKLAIELPDLAWLGPTIDGNLKSGGRLSLAAEIAGSRGEPRLRGQVRGDDLALSFLDQGVRLQQGRLAARFDAAKLLIDNLSFSAPHAAPPRELRLAGLSFKPDAGSLTATGAIDFGDSSGQLEIKASRVPLAQRPDRWIIASGHGRAGFAKDLLSVSGSIVADAGFLAQPPAGRPQLATDIVIAGRQPPTRHGPRVEVDIDLDLGEHFQLRAQGLEARLAGRLKLRGEPQRGLRAIGTIAARDASFEAYGQRLSVERGSVNFQGPIDDPGLNVVALRKGLSVEAGVEVTGTARSPQVRLVSTPAVPDPEKLSWIVLGRAPDAGGTDASVLLTAAGAILGGKPGGITSQLAQAFGVDELALRPADNAAASGAALSSQILSVGKRLSARAVLSYEQGLSAAAGMMKFTYSLHPRVSVVTRAGADNAIDVFYTFSFD